MKRPILALGLPARSPRRVRSLRRRAVALLVLAPLLAPTAAFADKVAVVSVHNAGDETAAEPSETSPRAGASSATSPQLAAAKSAIATALAERGHSLPSDSELLTAQMATRGTTADTRTGCRAAGRASGSDWTAVGQVTDHGPTYRLELEICQVSTGRVESLAREIAPSVAPAQVGEMLGYLVRPEGLGNAEIVWRVNGPVAAVPSASPPVSAPTSAPVSAPPVPRAVYAENVPIAIGLGVDARGAVSRPPNARGSGATFGIHGALAYALAAAPGLELRGAVGANLAGPNAAQAEVGARFLFPLVSSVPLFAGPELGLGAFFTLGASKGARFLARGALVLAVPIASRAQFEVAAEIEDAPGGAGALVLGGGSLRGLLRF